MSLVDPRTRPAPTLDAPRYIESWRYGTVMFLFGRDPGSWYTAKPNRWRNEWSLYGAGTNRKLGVFGTREEAEAAAKVEEIRRRGDK